MKASQSNAEPDKVFDKNSNTFKQKNIPKVDTKLAASSSKLQYDEKKSGSQTSREVPGNRKNREISKTKS